MLVTEQTGIVCVKVFWVVRERQTLPKIQLKKKEFVNNSVPFFLLKHHLWGLTTSTVN